MKIRAGEDRDFCLNILEVFNKTILVDAPLLNYNTSVERRLDLQTTENMNSHLGAMAQNFQ
jgi:hypothetical protein